MIRGLKEYKNLVEIEDEIKAILPRHKQAVKALLEIVEDWTVNDPVSLLFSELFQKEGFIREAKISDDKLIEDLKKRSDNKIPPGFNDDGKEVNSEGDLLIWHTILELGEELKRDIIFVSADKKNDWRYRSDGRPLTARHELIDEFRRRSSGNTFQMIQFSEFLELFGADKTVVSEVKREEQRKEPSSEITDREDLYRWLLPLMGPRELIHIDDTTALIQYKFQSLSSRGYFKSALIAMRAKAKKQKPR